MRKAITILVLSYIWLSGVCVVNAADLLYVSLADQVATFDVSLSTATAIANSKLVVASGIPSPTGITLDTANNLYVASGPLYGPYTIQKIALGSGGVNQFASGLSSPYSLTRDPSGNLYAANKDNNTVSKISPSGVTSTFASNFSTPRGLASDASGSIYVSDNSMIQKITPSGSVSAFANVGGDCWGLAFDSLGNLYAAERYTTNIYKITPSGSVSTFASIGATTYGIAIDRSDNVYAVGGSNIIKYSPNGTKLLSFLPGTSTSIVRYLAFAPTVVPEPSTYVLCAMSALVFLCTSFYRSRYQMGLRKESP